MAFGVRLTEDTYSVEPGTSAGVGVEIEHKGESRGQYEISVEGIDADWVAIPVPMIDVDADEVRVERFFLKPPRNSDSAAGTYPFVVTVRSFETGERRTAQGAIVIEAYNHISVEVSPKKGVVGAFRNETDFDVQVGNHGNVGHTLRLFASDNEDRFAYEFEEEQLQLEPGQESKTVMYASATGKRLLASPRLEAFTLTARSVDQSKVAGSTQGQLEQRALISPVTFALVAFVALLGLAWWLARPQPPSITQFELSASEILVGESVELVWATDDASSVDLTVGSTTYSETANGRLSVPVNERGELVVSLVAIRDGVRSAAATRSLLVSEPPTIPEPEILSFTIDPTSANLGDVLQIRYELSDSVVRALISELGLAVDPQGEGLQLTANVEGTQTLTLRAFNSEDEAVERSVEFTVTAEPLAQILRFVVSPSETDPGGGLVTVSYELASAMSATLSINGEAQAIDPMAGSVNVEIRETTELILTATDQDGRQRTVSETVTVPDMPLLPEDDGAVDLEPVEVGLP